jgi:hypothetical protein
MVKQKKQKKLKMGLVSEAVLFVRLGLQGCQIFLGA